MIPSVQKVLCEYLFLLQEVSVFTVILPHPAKSAAKNLLPMPNNKNKFISFREKYHCFFRVYL